MTSHLKEIYVYILAKRCPRKNYLTSQERVDERTTANETQSIFSLIADYICWIKIRTWNSEDGKRGTPKRRRKTKQKQKRRNEWINMQYGAGECADAGGVHCVYAVHAGCVSQALVPFAVPPRLRLATRARFYANRGTYAPISMSIDGDARVYSMFASYFVPSFSSAVPHRPPPPPSPLNPPECVFACYFRERNQWERMTKRRNKNQKKRKHRRCRRRLHAVRTWLNWRNEHLCSSRFFSCFIRQFAIVFVRVLDLHPPLSTYTHSAYTDR